MEKRGNKLRLRMLWNHFRGDEGWFQIYSENEQINHDGSSKIKISNQFLYITKLATPKCNKNLYNSGKSFTLLLAILYSGQANKHSWEREYSYNMIQN
jgi:hypothetical protein